MQFHGLLLVLKPTNRIKVRDRLEGFFCVFFIGHDILQWSIR